ncbi:vexin [Ascaphus truei]|uniref:vexin n=1 Tax=Ascaphus truei TaxID=8439 RepID=UPI003F5985B2
MGGTVKNAYVVKTKHTKHTLFHFAVGNSEKKTSKFCSSKQNVKSQKKSFPSSLVRRPAKQIATALPASHVTSVPEGCNKQRYRNTEEDHAFGSEASLPLTGSSIPKKAPSLLQKMGLKLKKTVEYIGASNCAFEDD